MPKNIVICCDGTDNKLTIKENTNVIHLYSCLEKSSRQTTYYHPGVGTIAPSGARSWLARKWDVVKDMVSASSLEDNVKDAYVFLMDTYEDGDKIFLFGFSRGAYTVRMLSGLIEMFGLLEKGNSSHLRYALEIYAKGDEMFEIANSYKSRFSRKIEIHFIGIWDTVVAAGGLISYYKNFPYSQRLSITNTVRHAIAIDERRKHYYYYEVADDHPNYMEVLFAGVHSDVGGSYKEDGLSKIALEWMIGEASNEGLILKKEKVERYVIAQNNTKYQEPDYRFKIHKSDTFWFKVFDLLPRARYDEKSWFYTVALDWRRWPRRTFNENAMVHKSVLDKMNYQPNPFEKNPNYDTKPYKPSNLGLTHNKYKTIENQPIKYQ